MVIEAEKLENKVVEAVDMTVDEMLKRKIVEPRVHMQHIFYNIMLLFAFGKTYGIYFG